MMNSMLLKAVGIATALMFACAPVALAQLPKPVLVSEDMILSGGVPKDGIPALTHPRHVASSAVGDMRGDSRVVGVVVNGEARAYPLNILVWHECINDTLGGIPIAVTFCPLCDSVFVFERRVGSRVLEFGISGLLYQSNVLLYDRQARTGQESLWSQIEMRAVAGPAAAKKRRLTLVDSTLVQWGAWRNQYPDSSVVSVETGHNKAYGRSPYTQYKRSDQLIFPITGRSGRRPDLANKDRVVVVEASGATKAYPVADLLRAPNNVIMDDLGGRAVAVALDRGSGLVDVVPVDEEGNPVQHSFPIKRAYTFWFAWDATHPKGEVYQP